MLKVLKAMADETRLRILALLVHGELTVGEFVDILKQSQPRVSRHLRLMLEAEILERFQEGTRVFYRLKLGSEQQAYVKAIAQTAREQLDEHAQDKAGLIRIRQQRETQAQAYFAKNAREWSEIRSLYVSEEDVEAQLKHMVGPLRGARVLDVGTGTGRMIELFGPAAQSATGIDVSSDMLSLARGLLSGNDYAHCQFRKGDMYDLPFKEAVMDLVLYHQVLHYAEDPMAALKEGARVLDQRGQMVIVDFAPHTNEILREKHAHRRLGFSDAEMRALAQESGLSAHSHTLLEGGPLSVSLWKFEKP